MSVVATLVTKDIIYLGADSLVSWGDTKIISPKSKLFHDDSHALPVFVGWVGSAEHASVFKRFLRRYEGSPDDSDDLEDVIFNMQEQFKLFARDRDIELPDSMSEDYNSFHVVFQGRAFSVIDYYIQEITNFDAIGCGGVATRAALILDVPIVQALGAACETNIHCDYPIQLYTIPKDGSAWTITSWSRQRVGLDKDDEPC